VTPPGVVSRLCRTSENSVKAKFSLPHRPGPESLACEGPYYGQVLSVSYVCRVMAFDTIHKKTDSPGCDWNLGPYCASKFSRSPHVTTRNRSQQIHATNATGYVANWQHTPRGLARTPLKAPGPGSLLQRTSQNSYSTQFVNKQECSQECNPKGSGYRE